MSKSKVYGSYKDGSDINKDKKGFYITTWNSKTDTMSKKYLKSLTNLTKKKKATKKKKTSKKKWWGFN